MRRIRHNWLFQPFKSHLHRTGLHAGFVEHVLETNPGPERIAHGAVRPLPAGYARLEETSRVARALIHRGELDTRQAMQNIGQRYRQGVIHVATYRQCELVDIDIDRNHRPVPAHIELIVWGEYAFVENFKRRFQQRWTGPLQDHRPFLWKGGRDLPLSGTTG